MATDIGEYLVGAYLTVIEGCDFVNYNVRPPGGGLDGLGELDVVGFDFKRKNVYVCEVTTHIRGLLIKNNKHTVATIAKKHARQRDYCDRYLSEFTSKRFMFWSPYVPVGYITDGLQKIEGLELIINKDYTARIDMLRARARALSNEHGNPAFRMLQILEWLRR